MTTKSSPNAKYRHISSVARQPSMGDPQGLMVDLIESLGVLWKKTSTSDYHVPIKVSINQYENLEGYPIYGNFTLPVYGWSSVLRFFFNVNMGRNLRHSVLEVSVRTRDHNLTNLESIDEWSVQNL
jgi:hypothetical protein